MSPIIGALARHSAAAPGDCALTDGKSSIHYRSLYRHVVTLAGELRADGARVVALALPNGPAWMIADLATLAGRIPCVPLPSFFSMAQQHHLLSDAGVDTVITHDPERYRALLEQVSMGAVRRNEVAVGPQRYARLSVDRPTARTLPRDTAKITYTSGTTGAPKGVCIAADALDTVAQALGTACGLRRSDRHCSLLPLATLLENVGVYAHLHAGGCAVLRPLVSAASSGGRLDGAPLLRRIAEDSASTVILVPEMLRALVHALDAGAAKPDTLRFAAVGGAPVSTRLLSDAGRHALPVYEGYGLTECGSVVALNTPESTKPGTVGRPLPHIDLDFTDEDEILVRGALYAGYIGDVARTGEWHRTGDRGKLDADGYLRLTGRAKNIFITSYGRNVSPEWVESELTAHAAIAQAWVYGEARPWNVGIVVASPGASAADIECAVGLANARLPDYARVHRWIPAETPFSSANGQLTPNGRLRRDALLASYRPLLQRMYSEDTHDVS